MGQISLLQELNLQYPIARRDESVVDDYHGVKVPDPYRWYDLTAFFCISSAGSGMKSGFLRIGLSSLPNLRLSTLCDFQVSRICCFGPSSSVKRLEDPDSDEVKDFVEKQADLGDAVLQSCDTREKIQHHILKLYDHPRFNAPTKHGNKYFYSHNSGLQAQSVLYVTDDLEGKPEVLLDPNTLSEDGTVSLTTAALSENSKYLGYGQAVSGSDWVTIKVIRVDDKAIEPDALSWTEGSTWIKTHSGQNWACRAGGLPVVHWLREGSIGLGLVIVDVISFNIFIRGILPPDFRSVSPHAQSMQFLIPKCIPGILWPPSN
ncbi:hypothetical protein ACLOJK_018201 [Asimina triloba]